MEIRLSFERYLQQGKGKKEALYESLKELILNGRLQSGERLPSSRKLSELYGLSRGTVSAVYDMLYAEGYVKGEHGSGTFISYFRAGTGSVYDGGQSNGETSPQSLPAERPAAMSSWYRRLEAASVPRAARFAAVSSSPVPPSAAASERFCAAGSASFSHSAADTDNAMIGTPQPPPVQLFASGQTDFRLFPTKEWKQSLHASVRELLERPLEDGYRELPAAGSLRLREAISVMLSRERGITAAAEQIVVTGGSKQGLALMLQLLADERSCVVVENPGYSGTREAAAVTGASILYAEVDERGIMPSDWEAALAAVTPNRQFPTGAVLPASRRSELLDWAARRGAILLEDDYDGEFRYTGRPGEPLKSMDLSGRVVYLGSFSRTMYSGLRIGYALAPDWLVPKLLRAKTFYEPYASGQLEQLALARFLQEGRYARHLGRVRRQYRKRLAALHWGLEKLPGKPFRWRPAHAGLHQYAEWTGSEESYVRTLETARQYGVAWSDGRKYRVDTKGAASSTPGALFGFAHLTEQEIEQGMKRLAEAVTAAAAD